jgi:hypothetical protein
MIENLNPNKSISLFNYTSSFIIDTVASSFFPKREGKKLCWIDAVKNRIYAP